MTRTPHVARKAAGAGAAAAFATPPALSQERCDRELTSATRGALKWRENRLSPGKPVPKYPTTSRLRLEVVPDGSGATLGGFIARNVEAGATIIFPEAALRRAGEEPNAVPGEHRIASNLKIWLRGTHHGVGADHLHHYLNESVFRHNRHFYSMAGFASLQAAEASLNALLGDRGA